MITGIDISRWQGIIDWHRVKQHVRFAVVKIGGSDVGFYPDGQAVRNVLEARAAGIEALGFYVYLGGAFSVADEVAHIKNLIHNIGGLRPGEFFCLDWEENHPDEVGYVHGIAKGLVDAGLPAPIIYMNLSYVKRNNWQRLVDLGCGLWVAAWGDNDAVPEANEVPGSDEWPFWAIWQYSSTGSVPGIAGRVDMNQFNGEPEQLRNYGSTRNVSMPVTVKTSQAIPSGTNGEYVVVAGDNLSAIAAKYGKSWQELWSLNRDRVANPNKIFPGLKLRVWGSNVPAAPAPRPADTTRYHTVVAGDNLSSIAQKYGLPSYVLLWEANKDQIPDPNLIRPGQKLRIP